MKKYIIALLLLCCLASVAQADDIQLQDGHPDRYVVVKGDTLWGISAKFLKDPWRWPQIWKMNREQIKNPHLIYPGDVVVLDVDGNGQPQLRLLRETITLEPGTIVEPLEKKPIPTISPSAIAPFLTQPLVINEDDLQQAPSIIGAEGDHVVLAPGFNVYVDRIEEGSGLNWQIFRKGKVLVDPDTKENLGIEAIYLGDARAIRYGVPATIEIVRPKEDIYKGDRLFKMPDTMMSSYVPRAPENDIAGRIISAYHGITELGPNAIVIINRGFDDGLAEGNVLAIIRPGKVVKDPLAERDKTVQKKLLLPDERIGLLMVFRTFSRVSYAIIMKAQSPVHVLDVVRTPTP
jgi:hypothetical protein